MSELKQQPPDPPPPPPEPADADRGREQWEHADKVAPRGPAGERASDDADAHQNPPDHVGVDPWSDRRVGEEGSDDRIWMAPNDKGEHSGFGVLEGDLNDVAYDGEAYRDGVQLPKDATQLDCYQFTKPCDIAVASTEANTNLGAGGIDQAFVPHVQQRIDDGTLKYVGSYQFDQPGGSV